MPYYRTVFRCEITSLQLHHWLWLKKTLMYIWWGFPNPSVPAVPWSHVSTPSDLQSIFINNINHMKNLPKPQPPLQDCPGEHLSTRGNVSIVCLQTSLHSPVTSCLEIPESLGPGCSSAYSAHRLAWAEQGVTRGICSSVWNPHAVKHSVKWLCVQSSH